MSRLNAVASAPGPKVTVIRLTPSPTVTVSSALSTRGWPEPVPAPPLRNVAEQAKPEKEISRNILAGLSTLGGRHQALEFGVVIPSGPIGDASSLSGVFLAQALKTGFEVGAEARFWMLEVG